MKIKVLFTGLVLVAAGSMTMVAQSPQMPPVPVDKNVRIGKLDNGLTYYIRHNDYPEHVANFYIAQRVGSINEEENQRGLAHFLEHMAFNGSEHFKGNGVIDWTRSIGVEFGRDLNAYTSIDQTVYNINNVPTKRVSALDSCLLILKDWSNGLSLDAEEIDKERDVVHNEWRMGEGASQRMQTKYLPKVYPNSKYGERLPIGLMSVVDNFKPNDLRSYYEKWYRPDNQALIIVGDVDVDHIEAEIKKLFAGIKVPANAAKVVDEPVPDNNEAIYVVESDKEAQRNLVLLMMKHDATKPEDKTSMMYLVEEYATDLIGHMLNSRLKEMTENPECPFVMGYAEDGEFILSKTKDAFTLIGVPKPGKENETAAALAREAKRAREFGFTATEYERAKADYLSDLEKTYTNRNKTENEVYAQKYIDNYLTNEPIPSIEDEYQTMNMLAPNIPVEALNQVLPQLICNSDTNLIVVCTAREGGETAVPTTDGLKKAVDNARSEKLEAYVDNVKNEPLIAEENMPKKGKIISEKENKVLGYKELTLSNGAKVILKKTDFKDDEVKMEAYAKGGESLYGEKDYTNLKLFKDFIGYSGLGNFSSSELSKALAGKKCNADLMLNKTRQTLTAHSTPKDLETMMQMSYLYFTNIKKDEKQIQNLMVQYETALKTKSLSPDAVFQDSMAATVYDHNPRYTKLQLEDLKNVNYDRILEIAKERFKNAGQFTFTIVGNFDEDSIRPLIEQYIASLPSEGKADNFKEVRTFAKGDVNNTFKVKTESAKATAMEYWLAKAPYTLDNKVKLEAIGEVLSMIYLKTIREDASAAYSVGAFGRFNVASKQPMMMLIAYCPMNPDKSDLAQQLLTEGINNAAEKIDADIVKKVKEAMVKRAGIEAKDNSHWIDVIEDYLDFGINIEADYVKKVEALTPESLASFLKKNILASKNHVKVVMLPDLQK